jgi:hypothetical protein
MRDKLLAHNVKQRDFDDVGKLSDPTSDISEAYRSIYKSQFPAAAKDPGFDELSAKSIKELQPMIDAGIRKTSNDLAKASHADEKMAKRTTEFAKAMDPDQASGRSVFGMAAKDLYAVSSVRALVAGKDLGELDSRQVTEFARVLDKLLTKGGVATKYGTEHLTPKSAIKSSAQVVEWLTNARTTVGGESFIKEMLKTVTAEEAIAHRKVANVQDHVIAAYADVKKYNPDSYKAVLDSFNERLGNPTTTIEKTYTNADVDAIMKQHGLTNAAAKSLLEKRGFEYVK